MVVPASMGLANAINFQPLGGGKAAITGDFVLIGNEVAPVMKALRENGIEVTALHNHMVGEQPRLYFMHFWAHDDALKLAAGLKAALSHVNHCEGLSAARAMCCSHSCCWAHLWQRHKQRPPHCNWRPRSRSVP